MKFKIVVQIQNKTISEYFKIKIIYYAFMQLIQFKLLI